MSSNKKRLSARLFLLKEMVVRDIRARYAGSGLGILWAFAQPILWRLLYTGVFCAILRVPGERDVSGLTDVFWVTPIVYPIAMIPQRHAWLLAVVRANPVTHLVEWYRAAFSTHVLPTPASALYLTATCVGAALFGAALFAKARPHFADLM